MDFVKGFLTEGISYITKTTGVPVGMAWAYVIVSSLVVVMAIAALVMWIIVAVKYSKSNHKTLASGKNSFDVAKQMLNQAGLNNIELKQAGFFRAWIYGNYYDMKHKTIYLRKQIANKNTITAVGLALQKVGIAKLCESGDAKAIIRYKFKKLGIFGPLLCVPTILLGILIDIFLMNSSSFVCSIIGIVLGGILLLAGFIQTLLTIPVEKKGNDMALQMIDETGIMTDEERKIIKGVFDAYIIAYVMDFIVTVLRIVQLILEILIKSHGGSSNS